MSNIQSLLLAAAIAVGSWIPSAPARAAIIDVGPETGSFTNLTRGFWFTAPTEFFIVGLDLPTSVSTENFDVAVLRLPSPPPVFSSTTSTYDVLFDARNQSAALSGLSIGVSAGDVIGILGSRGANSANSYGSGNYPSSILGNSVTLRRFGTQDELRDLSFNVPVWTEDASIGRVLVDVAPSAVIPLPATLPLSIAGLGLLAALRRRVAA